MRPSFPRLVFALAALVMAALSAPRAAAQPSPFERTVVVSPGRTPIRSGNRLLRALDRIGGASAATPYLLKIEPGVYDLGTESLVMKPWVDVEGSGEGVTRVVSSVDRDGTVVGAANAALRQVTIENDGPSQAIALRNDAAPFSALHVTCLATGGTLGTSGIVNNSLDPAVTFDHVTARATASAFATGISSRGGRLRAARAFASASDIAYAVFNGVSNGELFDVDAEAESTGRFAGAIRNEGGAPLLRNVKATSRGTDFADGIVNGAATAARIFGAVVHATGGTSGANGIRNEFATALVSQADITVEAPTSAFGVSCLLGGTPRLVDVTTRVTAGGHGIGVLTDGPTHATIDRSSLEGDGFSVANGFSAGPPRTDVGGSRLDGPVRAGGGALACVLSYDGTLAPLDAACLP